MARDIGKVGTGLTYEPSYYGPLDARLLVPTYDDLTISSNWEVDGESNAYNGMIVAVGTNTADVSKNGIYYLFDAKNPTADDYPDVTNESNWHKVAELDELNQLKTKVGTLEADIASKIDQATLDKAIDDLRKELSAKYDELEQKVDAIEVPDVSDFIKAEDLEPYATKEDVENATRGLVNEAELAQYAKKDELPSLDGYATEEFVKNEIAQAALDGGEVDLSGYATKSEVEAKADKTYVEAELAQVKEDLEDVYTKNETDAKIAAEIGKQSHFSAKVVTSTQEMTDSTTLYLIKKDVKGADVYQEYMMIDGEPVLIGDTSVDLENYATTQDVESVRTDLEAELAADKESREQELEEITNELASLQTDFNEFKDEVESNFAEKSEVTKELESIKETLEGKASEADLAQLEETVSNHTTSIQGVQQSYKDLEPRVTALEDVGAEKNIINSVNDEFSISENRELSINIIGRNKVSGLEAELTRIDEDLAKKVDKVTGSRLITEEEASKLEKLVLGEDGSVSISGEINADNVRELGDWITKNRDIIGGLLSIANENKLTGIEAGAQANKVEAVKIAGTLVELTNKVLSIPFATNEVYGVVLGSSGENKVSVSDVDGTMEVNSLNVNKLVQTDGDELIFDGGTA